MISHALRQIKSGAENAHGVQGEESSFLVGNWHETNDGVEQQAYRYEAGRNIHGPVKLRWVKQLVLGILITHCFCEEKSSINHECHAHRQEISSFCVEVKCSQSVDECNYVKEEESPCPKV